MDLISILFKIIKIGICRLNKSKIYCDETTKHKYGYQRKNDN